MNVDVPIIDQISTWQTFDFEHISLSKYWSISNLLVLEKKGKKGRIGISCHIVGFKWGNHNKGHNTSIVSVIKLHLDTCRLDSL